MPKRLFSLLSYWLTLLSSLFWVALRINYSGISKFLGADTHQSFLIMNLPVMVCVFSWAGFCLALWGHARNHRRSALAGFVIGLITAAGAMVVVYFGAWDYLRFILVHFRKSLAAALALTGFGWLLFHPLRCPRWLRAAVLGAAVLMSVVWGYQLRTCDFSYDPVVYAVEDDYQIVFSTTDNALGWVTIDGKNYFDLYAGSARSADRVHKITVPQAVLDAAGAYTVNFQQMIYRGPFGGYKGIVTGQSYPFRPVDVTDGLRYAALSDVHEAVDAAAEAAAGSSLDFLVLLGDLVSMVETEADAQIPNQLAHAITGGEIPVIYARGNHEIKGEYAEDLYKYVGSLDQGFSYTVTLSGRVFALVLDMGEDHEDDWWEYYGTAHFDLYRQQQTQMLTALLEDGGYEAYDYRMALCHIPIVYDDGLFSSFRQEWTSLLNQMEVDIALSGHEHRVWYFLPQTLEAGKALQFSPRYPHEEGKTPGGTVTDFQFPAFLCGQRSMAQTGGTQKWDKTDYLCLHTQADLAAGIQTSWYRNSGGKTVPMEYPFRSDSQNQATQEAIQTALS